MKILIVSGFLGAGKTTFIKEMLKKSGKYLVILENEYGENNIDSRDISNSAETASGDLKLLEFMEGCVCCTKKDSFSNTILTISAGLDPEYLVVEPSRVLNSSDHLKIRTIYPKMGIISKIDDSGIVNAGQI